MAPAVQTLKTAVQSTLLNYVTYSLWTLANKWQFQSVEKGGFGTSATPVLVTSFQMLVAGGIAAIFVLVLKIQRQASSEYFTWPVLKGRIIPLGLARAVDIGCGNFALVLVSVSMQQVVKSLLPVFVSILSVTLLNKHVPLKVWGSLVPIIFGCFFATVPPQQSAKVETDGHSLVEKRLFMLGATLAIVSCVARAFKAVLNAKLLGGGGSSGGGHSSTATTATSSLRPLEILFMEAPTTGIMLILPALMVGEGSKLYSQLVSVDHPQQVAIVSPSTGVHHISPIAAGQQQQEVSLLMGLLQGLTGKVFWYNVFCGVLMFFNQASYITIIEQTSALSCQVLMNVKMLFLIMISVKIFHNELSWLNYAGILLATSGVFLYAKVSTGPKREFSVKPAQGVV